MLQYKKIILALTEIDRLVKEIDEARGGVIQQYKVVFAQHIFI